MRVIGSSLLRRLSANPWVINVSMLQAFETVLNSKFIEHIKFPSVQEAKVDTESSSELKLEKQPKKAIIEISGTLVKSVSGIDALCTDFISMREIGNQIKSLWGEVDHLILSWDSPGGTVDGVIELSDIIYKSRDHMRVTSVVDGMMCSGALWCGTAADEVYALNGLSQVGSIGVVMCHVDQSAYDAKEGLKFSYIHAGSEKVLANPHEALSDKARRILQESVDSTYALFKATVAKHRGMTAEQVELAADAKIFDAAGAIKNGLIDGIKTMDEILEL